MLESGSIVKVQRKYVRRTVPGSLSGTALSLKVLDMVPVRRANALGSSAAILKDFDFVAASRLLYGRVDGGRAGGRARGKEARRTGADVFLAKGS